MDKSTLDYMFSSIFIKLDASNQILRAARGILLNNPDDYRAALGMIEDGKILSEEVRVVLDQIKGTI